jgi:hypothetical protein
MLEDEWGKEWNLRFVIPKRERCECEREKQHGFKTQSSETH